MATKFYKKPSPKQAIVVGGNPIRFEQVNIELGVYQTDDENVQREFAALQQRGVGGIFDIAKEDYENLKKKQTPSHLNYREEFGKAVPLPSATRPSSDLVSHAEAGAVSEPVTPQEAPKATVTPSKKVLPKRSVPPPK